MSIIAFSPALTLLYVFVFLSMLMGVDWKKLDQKKRWQMLGAVLILCVGNHLLRDLLSPAYGKYMLFFLHLPTFLLFLYIAKRGVIKTAFMILTAIVFTTPTVLISNLFNHFLPVGSFQWLLDLVCYSLMLLLTQYVFRSSFNYLLVYGDNRFFLLFSLVPLVYYLYMLAVIHLDVSMLTSPAGYVMRYLPSLSVFLFYFLLPYIYKTLREKMQMQTAQNALRKQLGSTEEQLALLNETNMQMALYRHDMRHHLIVLDGLLEGGKIEQAQEFVKSAMTDLEALTPKRFCENETVNLLCASYDSKARRLGVQLEVRAQLPQVISLSDTELCSVVANGLENALQAASQPEVSQRWVKFLCEVKGNKLLIQIQNPYTGEVLIRDGLPVSEEEGHGYGCRSIQSIAQRCGGLCSFGTKDGIFTFRSAFPLTETDQT